MDRRRRAARTVALMSLFTMTDMQENVPVASFDGDGSNLVSLIVGISPVQAGSGDPSPDNIRPISGWTGAKVTRTGKNLFDKSAITPNSWIVVNTTTIESAQSFFVSDYIPVEVGKTIVCTQRGASRAAYYDKWKNPISYVSWNGGSLTPLYDGYIRITDTNDHLDTLQVEFGTSVTDYEASQAETYSITFPTEAGSVYGGTLDVTSGKLTVDRGYALKPSCGNPLNQTNPSVILRLPVQAAVGVNDTANSKLISNCVKTVSANYQYTNSVVAVAINSTRQIRLSVPGLTTGEQYQAWINDNNFEVVYPIATPIVYDLDPVTIETLLGTNNIWADAGEVKYIEYNI